MYVYYMQTPQISDCFKIFGLDKSDEHLLVAEIHKVDEGTLSTLCSRIQGENIPLSRLKEFTDVGLIKKVNLMEIKNFKVNYATCSRWS